MRVSRIHESVKNIMSRLVGFKKQKFVFRRQSLPPIQSAKEPTKYGATCFGKKHVFLSAAITLLFICGSLNREGFLTLHRPLFNHSDFQKPNSFRETSHPSSSRSKRFPSVEQRVRLYMSDWYLPRCKEPGNRQLLRFSYTKNSSMHRVKNPSEQTPETFNFFLNDIPVDTTFSLDYNTISKCAMGHTDPSMKKYCMDVRDTVWPALKSLRLNVTEDSRRKGQAPFLFQFGDVQISQTHGSLQLPVIKKFRASMPLEELNGVTDGQCFYRTLSPKANRGIIWKLKTERHYGNIQKIKDLDVKWTRKKKSAVFRGTITGYMRSMKGYKSYNESSYLERCLWTPRCRLVYQHANSILLDARLTKVKFGLPETINDVQLVGKRMKLEEMLSYKAIIFLEGNDVSSGLKWGLYSQSVVLMPRPTFTSWAMEELLEPWVHYVPLENDLSDVEDKIRWVIEHDKEAYKISKRATQWISDLVIHRNAEKDDRKIFREILRRYSAHWSKGSLLLN